MALLLASPAARGQTSDTTVQPAPNPPPPPAAAGPSTVKPLTVTAKPPAYRRSIDRRSYTLAGDLQANSGSIGEALRNIPSVDVDPQGKISLRGDANVTILVDGQPSVMFQGQNRADALLQLPASRFERVEVMTNPSAAFSPQGSAGIVNLITRKSAPAVRTAAITLGGGTPGRYGASATGSYDAGRLSLSGTAGLRHTTSQFDDRTLRQIIDPASGEQAAVDLTSKSAFDQTSWSLSGSAAYQLNGATKLSTDLGYFAGHADNELSGAYRSSAASGALAQDYDNAGSSNLEYWALYGSSSYLKQLVGEDHQILVRLNYSGFSVASENRQSFTYLLPAGADRFQDLATPTREGLIGLTAEFKAAGAGPKPNSWPATTSSSPTISSAT